MTKDIHTIDATGKALGRVASEAALLLRGKGEVTFERHIAPKVKVAIINTSKARILQKKLKESTHQRYSGHPGGRTVETLETVAKRKGFGELFRVAVKGMIPNNKLKSDIMKNLTVSE